MKELESILAGRFLGNSLFQWTVLVLCTLSLFLLSRAFKRLAERRIVAVSTRRSHAFLPYLTRIVSGTSLLLLGVVIVWLASNLALDLSPKAEQRAYSLAVAALFLQFGLWGSTLIDYLFLRLGETQDPARRTALGAVTVLCKTALWVFSTLLILDNFSVNVTALVTGLGIGGVAVALAVQRILGDLLGSFSILLDRPFEIGDFIIVGDKMGSVEHIGIKSTRLRSLQGEQIIIGNNDLIQSKIQNFKRMQERRVAFSLRIDHRTPIDKLELVPGIIREIVMSIPMTRFDRAHVSEIGVYWLNAEVVYFMLSADFNLYMDVQQQINFTLLRRFAEAGVELARSTQLPPPDTA